MSFVRRELNRIERALREVSESDPMYQELYAAQQALAWTLEPTGFAAPADMVCKRHEKAVLPTGEVYESAPKNLVTAESSGP